MTLVAQQLSGVAPSLHSPVTKGSAGGAKPPNGIRSMTGYAQINRQLTSPAGRLSLELRSVNSRFLDLTIKTPESLRHLESAQRARLQQAFKRGKMELKLSWYPEIQDDFTAQLSPQKLLQRRAQFEQAARLFPGLKPPSFTELLELNADVNASSTVATDSPDLTQQIALALEELIYAFDLTRLAEGKQLTGVVKTCALAMGVVVTKTKLELPALLVIAQQKLSARLTLALEGQGLSEALKVEVAERVRQEVSALGLRADVAEEIERLLIHIAELEALTNGTGELGKRLDFLCQEPNRSG
jgi:uncharacterized protein (TIGR00255 family)